MIIIFTLIVTLFFVGLILKKKFSELCALCFAVAVTWILGGIYFLSGEENIAVDILSLGILMGGSIVGSMYYLSSITSKQYDLFKLPYFLSLFIITYFILTKQILPVLLISIIVLWIVFISLYFLRDNEYLKSVIKNIIECCKNW